MLTRVPDDGGVETAVNNSTIALPIRTEDYRKIVTLIE